MGGKYLTIKSINCANFITLSTTDTNQLKKIAKIINLGQATIHVVILIHGWNDVNKTDFLL